MTTNSVFTVSKTLKWEDAWIGEKKQKQERVTHFPFAGRNGKKREPQANEEKRRQRDKEPAHHHHHLSLETEWSSVLALSCCGSSTQGREEKKQRGRFLFLLSEKRKRDEEARGARFFLSLAPDQQHPTSLEDEKGQQKASDAALLCWKRREPGKNKRQRRQTQRSLLSLSLFLDSPFFSFFLFSSFPF